MRERRSFKDSPLLEFPDARQGCCVLCDTALPQVERRDSLGRRWVGKAPKTCKACKPEYERLYNIAYWHAAEKNDRRGTPLGPRTCRRCESYLEVGHARGRYEYCQACESSIKRLVNEWLEGSCLERMDELASAHGFPAGLLAARIRREKKRRHAGL